MKRLLPLFRLRFLSPYGLLLLFRAKRKHGANATFLLKFMADYYRNKIALADESGRYSFRQLYDAVLHQSSGLHARYPLLRDQTVVFACNNSLHHVVLLFALQNMGCKLVLVNEQVTGATIQQIISRETKACVVIGAGLAWKDYIDTEELKEMPAGIYFSRQQARVIFPTSGTTGESKLIEKRRGEFYWLKSFADLVRRTNIDRRKAMYLTIPVAHGFGYTAILFTLVMGKKTVLMHRKDHGRIASMVSEEGVDIIVGVPSSLYKTANLLPAGFKVHTMMSGGAAMNQIIFSKLTGVCDNLYSLYGSTEASTSFIADMNQLRVDVCSLGTSLAGVGYKLVAAENGEKELWIQSPMSNAPGSDGWVATGDLVAESEQGISWKSRKDDMIIKHGVNIYPIEIERELLKLDGIEDTLIKGIKDDLKGAEVIAFIQLTAGRSFDEQSMVNALRAVLPGLKIPDRFIVIDRFRYTNTGKKLCPELTV